MRLAAWKSITECLKLITAIEQTIKLVKLITKYADDFILRLLDFFEVRRFPSQLSLCTYGS